MAKIIKLEIDLKHGAETQTKAYTVDPDDLPLILLESLEDGKIGPMRTGIAQFLGLSEEESRQLTIRHIKLIAAAMKVAQDDPNERGGG